MDGIYAFQVKYTEESIKNNPLAVINLEQA